MVRRSISSTTIITDANEYLNKVDSACEYILPEQDFVCYQMQKLNQFRQCQLSNINPHTAHP